jgi:hypothetical protein
MSDKPMESWRARAAVSEALDVFGSNYMQEVWSKALARRETEPEAAVTSARTLLESVCKHILDGAQKQYKDGIPLDQLYRLAAEVLDIAPTTTTDPIFKKLFQSCADIIGGVGALRNHLSDAHGRGPFGAMPDWRHAELAVNLSAAMATYLAAVWKGRQLTITDVIRRFLAQVDPAKPLGESHRYGLERLARSRIGEVIAAQLQVSDLMAHCEQRRAAGINPATIMQDVGFLRTTLGDSHAHIFDKAMPLLRGANLVDKSPTRKRRPTHEEYDAIIHVLRESDKHLRTVTPMGEIMEFAVWSGRSISEIASLKWSDVDFEKRTCRLPGSEDTFPVLEKAWEMIEARRPGPGDKSDRIFPINQKTASQRHTLAKKKLAETMPGLQDLRFHDYRYEAVSRLLAKGHQPHQVARATGWDIKKVLDVFEDENRSTGR